MPKRKTAETKIEPAVKVEKSKLASRHKLTATKKVTQPSAGTTYAVITLPGHEDIARLAYSLWQQRGSNEGSPENDWLQAERQLLSKLS